MTEGSRAMLGIAEIIADHRDRFSTAYASGVLSPDTHYRLVEDIDGYAARAGIQPADIWTGLAGRVTDLEIDYVRGYRRHVSEGVPGLLYVGQAWQTPVPDRMALLAGAFLRNFVSARLVGCEALVGETFRGEALVDIDVLLIHDLAPSGAQGHDAKRRVLSSIIADRAVARRQTVVSAASRNAIVQQIGEQAAEIIDGYAKVRG